MRRPRLSVPGFATVLGAVLETGWAGMRLAGLPLEVAVWGVRRCAGLFGGPAVRPLERETTRCEPDVTGLPVIFVHGLSDRASIFTRLRDRLRGCGAGPFLTATYSPFHLDIRTAARALSEQVEQAREQAGGRPVCLVGHSLGGLIARYYVQRLGGDAHVSLVITLATPHSGTAMALLAPPYPVLRQLRPGSDLLAELAEPCPGCRTRFVAFYSDLDEAVLPAGRARLDHPDLLVRNILVHDVGHLMLPVHTCVVDEVRALLAAAVGVPPEALAPE
ncbi:alpha/beta fold hydrolase [Streptomyces sp. NPDC005925]|uniref:esterase/lipase family protein n=1 Tax=Streptomyces sp. NPDC005925 TaxID=3157172 RepID=UPI0033CE0AF2